jgi:hypothetical protein
MAAKCAALESGFMQNVAAKPLQPSKPSIREIPKLRSIGINNGWLIGENMLAYVS